MITLATILAGLFFVFLINSLIIKSKKIKFSKQTETQNLKSTEKIRHTGVVSGLVLLFISVLYINFYYQSETEILAEKQKKEELDKLSRKKLAEDSEIKRLGLTKEEDEILKQHETPVNSLLEEVKNAYLILKSQKYFVETEIIRFTGLAFICFESLLGNDRYQIYRTYFSMAHFQSITNFSDYF